jgi:DNA modification methylase
MGKKKAPEEGFKLHLGCSARFPGPIAGWENLDIKPTLKQIKQCDLTKGLPYPNDSVMAIYSCHTFEHFTQKQAEKVISECHRVMKRNAIIRIVVPDLERIIDIFYNFDKIDSFQKFGKKFKNNTDWLNFALVQDGQHKNMFTENTLKKLLNGAGFNVRREDSNKDSIYAPFKTIPDFPNESLGVEGIKP